MMTHTIRGGGGLRLHVCEWGNPDAQPILFIHGWSQSHLCWSKQFEGTLARSFRLVALDIRGHGQSEAPLDAASYANGVLWATDVRNVMDRLKLEKPVLVGWSYGGLIVGDYLRAYGDDSIGGINFVSAAVGIGQRWFGSYIGSGFLDHAPNACSPDQAIALKAIRDFLHVCAVTPITPADMELSVRWNMLVHPQVRANLIAREEDFTPELAKVKVPVLVSYGDSDTVVLPAMAGVIQDHAAKCGKSEYRGAGHLLFLEKTARFNEELADFARLSLSIA